MESSGAIGRGKLAGIDGPVSLEEVLAALADRPPSSLFAHAGSCCEVARAWFASMALSMQAQGKGPPLWISDRWKWGPVEWPLHWCEAMAAERLDCGALAALGRTAVEVSGAAVLPVQLVKQFDPSAIESWRESWRNANVAPWTWVDYVYHEAIALLDGTSVSLWDTTSACWVDAKAIEGYASLAAVRLCPAPSRDGAATPAAVQWRERWLAVGIWHRMEAGLSAEC